MAKVEKPSKATEDARSAVASKLAALTERRTRVIEQKAVELAEIDASAGRLKAIQDSLVSQPELADLIAEMRALGVVE